MRSRPTPTTRPGSPDAPRLAYPYTTLAGDCRIVLVAVDAIEMTGVWSVYDVPAERGAQVGWLIQRLDAHDEKLDAAVSLAVAYHADQVAFHAGERSEHPCPDPLSKPTEVPAGEIRKHAELAERLIADLYEPTAVAA